MNAGVSRHVKKGEKEQGKGGLQSKVPFGVHFIERLHHSLFVRLHKHVDL